MNSGANLAQTRAQLVFFVLHALHFSAVSGGKVTTKIRSCKKFLQAYDTCLQFIVKIWRNSFD
jgi:hypothetical protein